MYNKNRNMDNLNKAVNEVNDILITYINENDHLKDMIEQYQHTIEELQKHIEQLELQLTKSSPTFPEQKKGFLWNFWKRNE